ncbi:hypothetical protein AVEN_168582-1 [Araneus ventricosus]|uniref:Uncharacterized protein n=1 Tax=Araneus ventricosus TaxID=182803 RepID=A0A4Y2NGM4_ARAVE|nr:hypothetical protein AVEN_236468-1 [Araneus ventricosus]GBN38625.1 hypothetical protein AVEN_236962-1 [Araneus ventricosus]GBN38636.1 hypothetical protein AVEN_275289-1 [Araneus ventricosus]GBN38641.1 hypothetical protein AVEN_37584-1 [Araneus ventricosus]GBN38670.1 hypothetical protein AVEN_154349-1 [Araneus ventricosus]
MLIPLKILRVLGLLNVKSYLGGQRSSLWCGAGVWGVSDQVSCSSSDRGSKLRCRSQNSHRVSSKWDVTITKLNPVFLVCFGFCRLFLGGLSMKTEVSLQWTEGNEALFSLDRSVFRLFA